MLSVMQSCGLCVTITHTLGLKIEQNTEFKPHRIYSRKCMTPLIVCMFMLCYYLQLNWSVNIRIFKAVKVMFKLLNVMIK